MSFLDETLAKLADLIRQDHFEELETDTLEIKPVPADGGQWTELYKSANAFLNTRGGIVILGVKEDRVGRDRRYVLSGWRPDQEPKLKDLPKLYTDRRGQALDLGEWIPVSDIELRDVLGGRVAVLYVDELPADRKYAFFKGTAYKRVLTGDNRISDGEIERQEEFKEEALYARELQPVPGVGIDELELDRLNDYISQLNRPVRIESMKPDLAGARSFLERKCFIKDGTATTLGMLVCGRHPADHLGFRCHVHGYVDALQDSSEIASDKQDLADNILPLMERSLGYVLRNILVGVSAARGGTLSPQYPEALLRETVNNALAHRDYSINRQVILAIKPGVHIAIHNPGSFRRQLLIEAADDAIPLRRVIPEAKPRNPKLADVLRVYRKWEGRGIGMATLVDLCLQNRIDLPYYRLKTDEVALYLCAGSLLDERMERLFQSYDAHIETKLLGLSLSEPQKLVLAYLIKSEWANEELRYTVILTPDNNHFNEIRTLEKAGLICKHARSTDIYPVYVADRVLVTRTYLPELRDRFGPAFDVLDGKDKKILDVVYRFENYSKLVTPSARQVSLSLWSEAHGEEAESRKYEQFYRNVQRAFIRLEKAGLLLRDGNTRKYRLGDHRQMSMDFGPGQS